MHHPTSRITPLPIRHTSAAQLSDELCDRILRRLSLMPHGSSAIDLADALDERQSVTHAALERLVSLGRVIRTGTGHGALYQALRGAA